MQIFEITLRSKLNSIQEEKITSLTIAAESPLSAREKIEQDVYDSALGTGNLMPVFEIKEFKVLSGKRPSKSYYAWYDPSSSNAPSWWVGEDGLVKSANIISDNFSFSHTNYQYLGKVDIYLGEGHDPLMDYWNEVGLHTGDHIGPY